MNKRSLVFPVAAAIAIRLLVMPITVHGDVFHIWGVVTLFLQGIWDPFHYAVANYENIATSTFDVYYPPLAYLIYSVLLVTLSLFSNTLAPWLEFPRELVLLEQNVPLYIFIQGLSQKYLFWNIFLLKIPNIIYEFAILCGLTFLIPGVKYLRLTVVLWIFNPIVIYSAYMMGQIDLLTAALVLGAVVMAVKMKKIAGMTLLVLGTMVKVLPIVLLAPLAYMLGNSWKERLKLILYSIAIFVTFNLPFANDINRLRIAYFPPIMPGAASVAWRPDAVVVWGKLLAAAGIGIWLGWKIIVSKDNIKPRLIPEVIGLVLLLFFAAYRGALLNHYVVLMPFLILFWVKERHVILKMAVFSGLLFLTYIYTRPLQGELFTPLGIDWLTNFKSSRELVAPWFKYEHLSLATGAILSGWMITEAIVRGNKILSRLPRPSLARSRNDL